VSVRPLHAASHARCTQTCRGVGEVEGEAGEIDVGIIVPTDGFYGLQAEGGRLGAHLAVQVTGCPPLWQELLGPQFLKYLP